MEIRAGFPDIRAAKWHPKRIVEGLRRRKPDQPSLPSIVHSSDASYIQGVIDALPVVDSMARRKELPPHPFRSKEARQHGFEAIPTKDPNRPLYIPARDPRDPDRYWRRKKRNREPELYTKRGFTRNFVWGLLGYVDEEARRIADDPKHHSRRLRKAIKQELNDVTSSDREMLLNNWVDKAKNFVVHHGISFAAETAGQFALSVPAVGRVLSAAWSTFVDAAPENIKLNAAMLCIDVLVAAPLLAGALALFGPAGAFLMGVALTLFNMRVNGLAGKHYQEVNNKAIFDMYGNVKHAVAINRLQPESADSRVKDYQQAFLKVARSRKRKSQLDALILIEHDLNFAVKSNRRLHKGYNQEKKELSQFGRILDMYEALAYEKERDSNDKWRWWEFVDKHDFQIEMRNYGDIVDGIDDFMYTKFEFPHHEAQRLLQMWNLAQKAQLPNLTWLQRLAVGIKELFS